ncbi:Dyp-type peroxidase [Sphingorhabdus sp. Alg231-15]|uniref:Dyp-type peroxidase n=1 Tax=Sphingorhabdus sp. Alg231-15 TaxID=1922222 RepID=UPI00307BD010
MSDQIQEGIHFRSGESPPPHFSVVFLNVVGSPQTLDVQACLEKIWETLTELKTGQVHDLPGTTVDPSGLTVLIGFGSRFFDSLSKDSIRPSELRPFRKPRVGGGGPISLGAGLSFDSDVAENPADCDLAIQFTGETALSVRRAVVETWKAIDRFQDSFNKPAPLRLNASFNGFGREDRRSWIDFFDGTSNLRSEQRLGAIEIKERSGDAPDNWKENGTYLCYMRIAVDISSWQKLSRSQKEQLVGRDMVSGCPLVADANGGIQPISGCPANAGGTVEDGQNERFRFAPRPAFDATLRSSHIHRANQGRSTPADPESRLVYRQGYEFLEGIDAKGCPQLGLNFISFQDTPERILGMLKIPGWLGRVNFGGDPNNQLPGMANLLRVRAAGFFVVPPRKADDSLPASELFI